jgi:hypothetical protein
VRLISPFPPDEVKARMAHAARSKPLLGHWGSAGPANPIIWMRLRRDQGVRARFVADNQVLLEQWIQVMDRLTVDSCRVELTPLERGEPSPGGTLIVCHFFVPAARQAVKIVMGGLWLVFGLAFVIGSLADTKATAGGRAFLLLFGGANAAVGVLGLYGVRPRARRSQEYVLSWLEQAVTANRAPADTGA